LRSSALPLREQPDRTATGLAHLLDDPNALADLDTLISEIDTVCDYAADPEALRDQVVDLCRTALDQGREAVARSFQAAPLAGLRTARSYAHVTDVVVSAAVYYVSTYLHPLPVRTKGEHMAVIAVGGYGRGEMAPFSDVDLLFLTPYKQTAWSESVIESTLYILWDLKLKLGQSVRSIDDCLRLAREDLTIRTALLEQRFLCGDRAPYEELDGRLWQDLFRKTGPEFVEGKLAERDARHERHGGSRYLLEPNLKEGKGGLRDLQTLHWISKYLFHTDTAWDLVEMGVFQQDEVQRFADAAKFIWAVRCHLHDLVGRAQEKLTFDWQVEIAARMGYNDHDGRMGVEHFMHTYFRQAKAVGDLTRIFSAALEAQHAKTQPTISLLMRALSFRTTKPDGDDPFTVQAGRLTTRDETVLQSDPLNILRLFREAARLDAQIHPMALRQATQSLDLVAGLQGDPKAAEIFLEMLCDPVNAEWLLRRMNETEVLERLIPEFGRIVAMMQFNMYHHYTVDEHTIRTIGVLNGIERQEAVEELPVATEILNGEWNRRVLYVALLLHDIGKGDKRDHSDLGAEMAADIAPRLGLSEAETEMVVWLVQHHLVMSDTAQKRDVSDPRTVADFARFVQSPERLRLLLVLTVCDIQGVGPGVWNNWKAQLLRNLYWDTRDVLTGGAEQATRAHRVDHARAEFAGQLEGWTDAEVATELARHYPHYWLGLDQTTHAIFADLARNIGDAPMASHYLADESRDATVACLYMGDHPGLFSRMAGAFALAGANVVDARTYTTNDGMATSVFWIQDSEGRPYEDIRLPRLGKTIEKTLKGEVIARVALDERDTVKPREQQFTVPTRIVFDNDASDLYTVIEVNARDRLGLLHELTRSLADLNINIFSAIIATYGEHAVDVFYVKDLFGMKIRSKQKMEQVEKRLTDAIDGRFGAPGA
jgi:[protein-PII] uridylyltransferase